MNELWYKNKVFLIIMDNVKSQLMKHKKLNFQHHTIRTIIYIM